MEKLIEKLKILIQKALIIAIVKLFSLLQWFKNFIFVFLMLSLLVFLAKVFMQDSKLGLIRAQVAIIVIQSGKS